MSTTYARSVQAPTGVMQARDLQAGDDVLIRRPGEAERTPNTIRATERIGGDVVLAFDGFSHVTSPRMGVALA
jgi:hypothetical protein